MKLPSRLFVLLARADGWHICMAWCAIIATAFAVIGFRQAKIDQRRADALIEEVHRLRFQLQFGAERKAFEQNLRHHETNR